MHSRAARLMPAAVALVFCGGATEPEPAPAPGPTPVLVKTERIVISGGGALASIDSQGGDLRALTAGGNNYFAAISPDGRRIAFTTDRDGNPEIYLMQADGSGVTNLTRSPATRDWWPRWSPDGASILFYSWDDAAGSNSGEIYSVRADGGAPQRLTNNSALDADPEWSPDGSRIVFMSERDGDQEIYVMNSDGTNPIRLTHHPGLDGTPAWSPDGTRIAFASTRFDHPGTGYDIMVMNADGSSQVRLTDDADIDVRPVWSRDGTRLIYSHRVAQGNYDVLIMDADGSNKRVLVGGPGNQQAEAWGMLWLPASR